MQVEGSIYTLKTKHLFGGKKSREECGGTLGPIRGKIATPKEILKEKEARYTRKTEGRLRRLGKSGEKDSLLD